MEESALARLAALTGGAALALLLGAVALGIAWAPDFNEIITRLWGLAWIGFPVVGTIIALKRPRARIGWLLIGKRLRDEVDLDALALQLRQVAAETVQPSQVSVWVRSA